MIYAKCGHEIPEGAAFCPYCGEKVAQGNLGPETPLYQADVKTLLKSGRLVVYRDRTEFVSSSVQKTIFYYTNLVSVKKNLKNDIDFITEDGRTETCPADKKCVHEAFVHIEQASSVYLAQRKKRLLSQGIRYSFPSSQGFLNDGVLNLSGEQAEFKAKSGKSDVVFYRDVKFVNAYSGILVFTLFGGGTKSFVVSKELQNEVLAFVTGSITPYLAQREEDLRAQGIFFSSYGPDGGTLDIRADRAEYKKSGQVEDCVPFQDVRSAGLYGGTLELALTDGTSKSFPIEEDVADEVLAFIKEAIEPYVVARTVGFNTAFGIDERIEFNGERGVFHIIRQDGREITSEWPMEDLIRCKWTEDKKLTVLGSMVSGGIDLFKSAAKAAGRQTNTETEEKIGSVDVVLTIRTGRDVQPQSVCFGRSSVGMSRTDKKYSQCLTAWGGLLEYLKACCPECELINPIVLMPESAEGTDAAIEQWSTSTGPDIAVQRDDLNVVEFIEGVSRFISGCPTPMTIAFQGNRDSGKSEILQMLFKRMEAQYGKNLLWLNARQLPQSDSGESSSFLVGKKLVELLKSERESNITEHAGTLATSLAAVATGIFVKDTSLGKELVGGVLNKNPAYTQENPLELFSKQIKTKVQEKNGRVIFFIDGLDQLAPTRAVDLLNAMQDFFECEGCVFVVSADSEYIFCGAQERYDENKAKHFFGGIFKRTYRVPVSGFNIKSNVKDKLRDMDIRAGGDAELELYVALIQNSVGNNTVSIDRLFGSYHQLKDMDMTGGEVYKDRHKRLLLFALLCIQMQFRDIYDYAVRRRDSVTPEFLASLYEESAQPWDTDQTGDKIAAYRDFSRVFAQIINLDGKTEISESECQAFAEVLELSSITS